MDLAAWLLLLSTFWDDGELQEEQIARTVNLAPTRKESR
jgi:hypothetical protein